MRELRKKKGLTQRQLAELAGTSQQQIQRIEGGVQNARFDLAFAICAALDTRMQEVFPSTELALKRSRKRVKTLADVYLDSKASEELEKAGIDMEPRRWTLIYRLRGGAEGMLPISGPEYSRIWRFIQLEESDSFIVFDSVNRRYAINIKHLIFCQFQFDVHGQVELEEDDGSGVQFYLSDKAEPLTFLVDRDVCSLDEEDSWVDVQLQDMFHSAEMGPVGRFKFKDIDGETAFFRPDDVAMFSVELRDLEPAMWSEDEDDEDEIESEGHG